MVNIHVPYKNHEYLTGKNAVVVSTTMSTVHPESVIYGLYKLDKLDQIQFYYSAKNKYLNPLKRSLPYHYESPSEEFKKENMMILPKPNSSFKISSELRNAVRQSINNVNLIDAINKHYRILVYIKKEIRAGETLKHAHGPYVFKHDLKDIDRLETPFSLPRQVYTITCPENLVQIEIEFIIKINRGANQTPFEFCPYFLSLLVDTKNSTIWDARVKPREPEDYPILK